MDNSTSASHQERLRQTGMRRVRFGIRGMLVVLTALAMVLAWIGYERRISQYELRTSRQLTPGRVDVRFVGRFDDTRIDPDKQVWWRSILSAICGERVDGISHALPPDLQWLPEFGQLSYLSFTAEADTDLAPLSRIKSLRVLQLYGAGISDISFVGELPQLLDLSLTQTNVSDLSPLAQCPKLWGLNVYDTQLAIDYSPCANAPNLHQLVLSRVTIGDDEIEELRSAMPECKIVDFP